MTHPLHDLADGWRDSAEGLRHWGATHAAIVLERAAGELDAIMESYLRPREAAEEQGFYSESAIRSMLSDGRLTNYGEPGRPLVRRGDVWGVPRRHPLDPSIVAHLVGTG